MLIKCYFQYEIDDLKKLCEIKILLNLTKENAPAVFELANIYRCACELKTEAFELIKKYVNYCKFIVCSIFFCVFICSRSFLDNNYEINDNLLDQPEKLRELLEMKRNLELRLMEFNDKL